MPFYDPYALSNVSILRTKSKSEISDHFLFSPCTQAFLLAFLLTPKMFSPSPETFSPRYSLSALICTIFSFLLAFLPAFLLAFLLELCSMKMAFSPSFSPKENSPKVHRSAKKPCFKKRKERIFWSVPSWYTVQSTDVGQQKSIM